MVRSNVGSEATIRCAIAVVVLLAQGFWSGPARGETVAKVALLRTDAAVVGNAADAWLSVDAVVHFRCEETGDVVHLGLRADFGVVAVEEDGRSFEVLEDGEKLVVREPCPADGRDRTWVVRYRWPLGRRLDRADGVIGWFPWYPTILPRSSSTSPMTVQVDLPTTLRAVAPGNWSEEATPDRRRFVVIREHPSALHPLLIGRLAMAVHATDGVTARAFGPPNYQRALTAIADWTATARVWFGERLGRQDLAEYATVVVPLPEGHRGMTVPGLTLLSTVDLTTDGVFDRRIAAHELAHNWWGLAVDFPSPRDAWLKEGLPTYSAILFIEERMGDEALRRELANSRRIALVAERPGSLLRVLDDGAPGNAYAQGYHQAAYTLHMLRTLLGRERFLDTLREFYERHRGGVAGTEAFRRVFADAGVPSTFWEDWVESAGLPEFEVTWRARSGEDETWTVEGTVRQTGNVVRMPVGLRIVTSDGHQETTVELRGRETRFVVACRSQPEALEFDPRGDLLHAGVDILFRGGSVTPR